MDNAASAMRRVSKRPNTFEPGIGGGQGRRKEDELEGKRAKLGGPDASTSQDAGAEKMVPISSVLGKLLRVVMELQAGKQKLREQASEPGGDGYGGVQLEVLRLQDGKCVVDRAVEALMHTTNAVGVLGSATTNAVGVLGSATLSSA